MPLRTFETDSRNATMSEIVYAAADVAVLGTAGEFIRGAIKGLFFDDGPGQELRTLVTDEVD
jgi:hypothetical protein